REIITIDNIAQIFAKIPDFLISFIVYLIALFLFMLELPILKSNLYSLLRKETAEKVSFMNTRLSSVLFGFFKAQFLVSLIILAVSLIGLYIIVPEVALIMALIIWLIDLIPIIGSIIILGPWALVLLLTGDVATGVQLAVLAVILLAIRRTVEPKVMGQHIGLSPLATLISMFIGLKLFGILGFIIGPLIVIAFTSAREAGIIKWNIKI
ncbi:sporulation integral membrane protein YtvI, partial [Oceanobacillus massiliensis]